MDKGSAVPLQSQGKEEESRKKANVAAAKGELPSPKGKDTHAKHDRTVKTEKKKRNRAATPEPRRTRSRTPERKGKKSNMDNDKTKNFKKAEAKRRQPTCQDLPL